MKVHVICQKIWNVLIPFNSSLACQAPNYGDNCAQICSCGPGAIRCDPSRGCVCNSAWTGPNCDQDVDECTTTPGICGNDKTCTNTNGGYECSCTNAGYEKVSDDNSVPCSGNTIKKIKLNGKRQSLFRFKHLFIYLFLKKTICFISIGLHISVE